jgi:hypothetical protein
MKRQPAPAAFTMKKPKYRSLLTLEEKKRKRTQVCVTVAKNTLTFYYVYGVMCKNVFKISISHSESGATLVSE